ncbi:unnamed protein product [Chrysoparadoxa australica]
MAEDPDPFLIPSRANEGTNRYAARMVYLMKDDHDHVHPYNGPIPDGVTRPLKPPALFMSRKQAKNDCAINRQSPVNGGPVAMNVASVAKRASHRRSLDFEKKMLQRRDKRNRQGQQKKKEEEEAEKIRPEEWKYTTQAGVRFWVNEVTGTATDLCPHPSLSQSMNGMTSTISTGESLQEFMGQSQEMATGCVVSGMRCPYPSSTLSSSSSSDLLCTFFAWLQQNEHGICNARRRARLCAETCDSQEWQH